ncbi:uncharacterized protein (DUF952 family) [Flavobacterium sp. 2755]|uniref:hypothetical protein n=1 Tax=Flavobacterium sp. 2755 TaxID=2817765 RepID=UPI002863076F|nr:hypothetical protein [Flavobacterium sp. 2755]MDR6761628.1 uncharacterized protein (DUF952 family) [Flavobacterium sp. 2755]
MSNIISILENGKSFTPFYFYTEFLPKVARLYGKNSESIIQFSLIGENDSDAVFGFYYIDPISIPLFLSLAEQLKKFHGQPLNLLLSNNSSTNNVLTFLDKADFFHIIGNNVNPLYAKGKNIFNYDRRYLGDFINKTQRPEHKIRCYSLLDDNLNQKINELPLERKRDFLVEYFTYKVKEHFALLLQLASKSKELTFEYIEILAELITNGVLHSSSDAYALMFANIEKTSFSISDNGIGLYDSLLIKETEDINFFYSKFDLFKKLQNEIDLKISDKIQNSLFSIFETMFYSLLKDRKGLFDLMCNVVLNCDGYFRLHNQNAQIIVSARMFEELNDLYLLRIEIMNVHKSFLFEQIDNSTFRKLLNQLSLKAKNKFIELAKSIINKHQEDVRYSSIRLYEVRFRGVHIEVEIPNHR